MKKNEEKKIDDLDEHKPEMIENFCKFIKKNICMDRADLGMLRNGYRFENFVKFLHKSFVNFHKVLRNFHEIIFVTSIYASFLLAKLLVVRCVRLGTEAKNTHYALQE